MLQVPAGPGESYAREVQAHVSMWQPAALHAAIGVLCLLKAVR